MKTDIDAGGMVRFGAAASMLGVTQPTLRKLIAANNLETFTLAGAKNLTLLRREDVVKLVVPHPGTSGGAAGKEGAA